MGVINSGYQVVHKKTNSKLANKFFFSFLFLPRSKESALSRFCEVVNDQKDYPIDITKKKNLKKLNLKKK